MSDGASTGIGQDVGKDPFSVLTLQVEAAIRQDGDGWVVYSTDERAAEAYRRRYDEEAPALADFLQKARANTRYFRRLAERSRVHAEEVLRKRNGSDD